MPLLVRVHASPSSRFTVLQQVRMRALAREVAYRERPAGWTVRYSEGRDGARVACRRCGGSIVPGTVEAVNARDNAYHVACVNWRTRTGPLSPLVRGAGSLRAEDCAFLM